MPSKACRVDLEELLQAEASAGSYESSGQFEIDLEQAAAKLSLFQLGDPAHYLLKAIQAMVGWRCDSIRISLSGSSARLIADFPDGAPLPKLMSRADFLLEDPLSGQDSPDKDLVIAWRSALALTPFRMTLEHRDRERSSRLEWVGGTVRVVPLGQTPKTALVFTVYGGGRLQLHERVALTSRCRYASVPIFLENARLNQLTWGTAWAGPLKLPAGYFLVERYLVEMSLGRAGVPYLPRGFETLRTPDIGPLWRGHPRLTMPGRIHLSQSTTTTFLRENVILDRDGVWTLKGPTRPGSVPFSRIHSVLPMCRGLLAISGLHGQSLIHFVKNGVMLDPIWEQTAVPGCQAVLSGRDVQVDLSQLRVSRDQAYAREIGALDVHLSEMLRDLVRNGRKLKQIPGPHSVPGIVGGLVGGMSANVVGMYLGYRAGVRIGKWFSSRRPPSKQIVEVLATARSIFEELRAPEEWSDWGGPPRL